MSVSSGDFELTTDDLAGSFDDNEPRFRHAQWRKVFEEQSKSTPLSLLVASDQLFSLPLAEHEESFETWLPKDKIWERYSTLSQIATLEGEELDVSRYMDIGSAADSCQRTHKAVVDAMSSPDVSTDSEGRVAIHGRTITAWTSKIPAEGRSTLTGVERKTPATDVHGRGTGSEVAPHDWRPSIFSSLRHDPCPGHLASSPSACVGMSLN